MNKSLVIAVLVLAGVIVAKAAGSGELGRYGVTCWRNQGSANCVTFDTSTGRQVGKTWMSSTPSFMGSSPTSWDEN